MHSVKEFLNDLFYLDNDQLIEIRPSKNGRMIYGKWSFFNSVDDLLSSEIIRCEDCDVFFGIASRKISNTNRILYDTFRCLAFDVDHIGRYQYQRIFNDFAKINLLPNYIISSGSGIHCYLLIVPTNDAEKVVDISRRISLLINSDPRVHRVSQFMRLPGTYNKIMQKSNCVEILHRYTDIQIYRYHIFDRRY